MIEQKIEIIGTLFAAYGQSDDVNRMEIYVTMLKDFPLEALKKACTKAILNNRFLPSIAELLTMCRSFTVSKKKDFVLKDFAELYDKLGSENIASSKFSQSILLENLPVSANPDFHPKLPKQGSTFSYPLDE